MKKQNKIKLVSHEQMKREPWTVFAQIQQQAKTGTISVDPAPDLAGTQPAIEGVAAADPLRATLGGAMVLGVKASDLTLAAVGTIPAVDLDRRIAFLKGTGVAASVLAALDAATNAVISAELTFDGGLTNNAPMTNAVANGTGISTAVNTALAAAKPAFSVQSIVNKLEDLLAAAGGAHTGVVLVDQENEKVYLVTAPVANEATLLAVVGEDSIAGNDIDAAFLVDANPASAAEGQFGE